jgi:hypothetical protein
VPKPFLTVLAAVLALALSAPPAPARTRVSPVPHANGLGVITAVSTTASSVTAACFFTGTEATGFVMAVPHGATLSSLTPAQIARDISLTTLSGTRVHYILLSAEPDYLAITLHFPQPALRLTFQRSLFRFSRAESQLIRLRTVRSVRMGLAFSGGPGQLVASKFAFAVSPSTL